MHTTPLIFVLAATLLLSGCASLTASSPSDPQAAAETDASGEAPPETAAIRTVFADDGLTNLQLSDPSIPLYDPLTLAERRSRGFTTAMPQLTPYKDGKVVYLTFDDGPDCKNTPAILAILQKEQVKATFFVTGQHTELYPDMLRRIYEEGHAIGNHSYDHNYKRLYPSPAGYLQEMEQTDEIIHAILGVRPLITRAPGGTAGHFTNAYAPALRENGYTEYGWNVSSADAAPNHPVAQDFIDNIASQIENPAVASHPTILMHCSEGHEETVKALPAIIKILKEHGYTFGVISPMTPSPW